MQKSVWKYKKAAVEAYVFQQLASSSNSQLQIAEICKALQPLLGTCDRHQSKFIDKIKNRFFLKNWLINSVVKIIKILFILVYPSHKPSDRMVFLRKFVCYVQCDHLGVIEDIYCR